ncbi:MAG: hypothetical protein H9872_09605 [Candidatus Cellulosilyticum pullistercoris]|uniref:Membrane-spanning protein n=1 Tax=Candidatus Cellulosilyticum pullistercoris TaxID=2838521 RepID=A0A9E2NME8_9FIRM|nr:hypothetical protein [Candidatus Cellulosilyticum pullistercoris]
MNKNKIDLKKAFNAFVLFSLIATTIFLIYAIAVAPVDRNAIDSFERVKSDYILMFVQCLLGIFAMLLPGIIEKKIKIEIPSTMLLLYTLFLYCAIYLGEVKNFYYTIPYWDTILHTCSGAMLGALGFSFVSLLNRQQQIPVQLTPVFVSLFAFCFAITLGVFWEIYEFTFDGILGLNMQKFALETGELLVGRSALLDTMKDLIVDSIGAFVMSVIGYISIKYKKGWIEELLLTSKK